MDIDIIIIVLEGHIHNFKVCKKIYEILATKQKKLNNYILHRYMDVLIKRGGVHFLNSVSNLLFAFQAH